MNLKYKVELSQEDRDHLKALLAAGTASARRLRRAQILLKSDSSAQGPNWNYEAICRAFDVSNVTVSATRKAYCEGGLEAALRRKPPERTYARRLDGAAEAHLIALACSEPPDSEAQWTLRLLRDKMLELEYVDTVSHETVRQVLKKMNLNLG
jgi:transposase-like protein